MAGLGEACSHIAAVLSALVNASDMRNRSGVDACTSKPCSWLPPAHNVTPAPVKDIMFLSPANSRKRSLSSDESQVSTSRKIDLTLDSEQQMFFKQINRAKNKPAILKIINPYADNFIPTPCLPSFPKPLTDLYNPAALQMEYLDLIHECEQLFLTLQVTVDEAKQLEFATRGQTSNKLWLRYRAGRITASKFEDVISTNADMPSQSLITSMCYPDAYRFSNDAIRWGTTHESDAIELYRKQEGCLHKNLSITNCGLYIDTERPYLGASPDAIVHCDCCGHGVIEVKCPYTFKDGIPEELPDDCFLQREGGKYKLKHKHAYYYQVQMQLSVCNACYCDFVVWTTISLSVERILVEGNFLCDKIDTMKHFFIYGLLPEIVGKWYSRKPVANSRGILQVDPSLLQDTEDYTKLWCYCKEPSYGDMIKCDDTDCCIQWYHFDCLRIQHAPKGKWYCPSCRIKVKMNKKTKN